jgi:hypothetical protein
VLESANIEFASVGRDVFGVSGLAMLGALADDHRFMLEQLLGSLEQEDHRITGSPRPRTASPPSSNPTGRSIGC